MKGYRLYDKAQKRVFYSRDVTFNEVESTEDNEMAKNIYDQSSLMVIEYGQDADVIDKEEEEPQRRQRERHTPNGIVNGSTLSMGKILSLQKWLYQVQILRN